MFCNLFFQKLNLLGGYQSFLSFQNRDYSSDSSDFTETEEDNDDELLTFEQFLGLKTTPEKNRKVLPIKSVER